jgi:DNA-binding transcriptional LysR family regulator
VTPLGEEIVRQAQQVIEQARHQGDRQARQGPGQRPAALGIIYTIGPYLLPDLVKKAIERVPQMPLMLQENFTAKLLEMLRTGELDCAIMAEPFPDTGLAVAPLYDEPWWPNQLNLGSCTSTRRASDPMGEAMGEGFDYAEEFKSLDLDAVSRTCTR